MGKYRSRQAEALRRLIAVDTARLISEHGICDYDQAKLEASERLGLDQQSALPSNREIEQALREQQSLFALNQHQTQLHSLREAALKAMQRLSAFSPRLVGPVLDGTANEYSPVQLQIFVDNPEQITVFLHDRAICFKQTDRALYVDRDRSKNFPVFEVEVDGIVFELITMAHKFLRQPPLSTNSGKAVSRASIAQLRDLIATEDVGELDLTGFAFG